MDAWVIFAICLVAAGIIWIGTNVFLDWREQDRSHHIHIYYVDKEDDHYALVHWSSCWCFTGRSYDEAYWQARAEFKTVISTSYLTKVHNNAS